MWMQKISRSQYLPLWIAAGVVLIVVELLALGWVAKGQVDRSSRQQAEASALRVRLWSCLDAGAGPLVDRCRADVMARAGGGLPSGMTQLATYVPDASVASDLPRMPAYNTGSLGGGGLVPVSMTVPGLR